MRYLRPLAFTLALLVGGYMSLPASAQMRINGFPSIITTTAGGSFGWTGRARISSPGDGLVNITDNAGTAGIGLNVTVDGSLLIRNRAQNAYGGFIASIADVASAYRVNGALAVSVTAPTISSGFGTSPSVVASNGTAAFTINVGTGGSATSGVIGLPSATTGWKVDCDNVTTNTATVFVTKQTATSTTTATVGNYDAAGVAAAWVASNILVCSAMAY